MTSSPTPTPPPLGITMMQATRLKGWIALDGRSEIVGHAPSEADLRATLGHVPGVTYFACHHFEEPLQEERVGTRIAFGHSDLRVARTAPEDPRAATARLSGRLRILLAGVHEIGAQVDMRGKAPVWALAYWTTSSETEVLANLRTLRDRRLVDYRLRPEPEAWVTPLGRQVARLVNAWRKG